MKNYLWLLIVVSAALSCALLPDDDESATPIPVGTPTAAFEVGFGYYVLFTNEPVGAIPANTRVRSGGAMFNGEEYLYTITADEITFAEARESQLRYAPDFTPGAPTPTTPYMGAVGYVFITTAQVGDILPDTNVALSPQFDGYQWVYTLITRDGVSAIASESQFRLVPGITPGAPTPTSQFLGSAGYVFRTQEQIGDLPADTAVAIGSAYFDGFEWIFSITTRAGISATARESQLAFAPDITPAAPIPTASFQSWLGMGVYWVITQERIGSIPANTPVRVSSAHFDGYEWVYTIATDNDLFEEARESQLVVAPGITLGAPTPTTTP